MMNMGMNQGKPISIIMYYNTAMHTFHRASDHRGISNFAPDLVSSTTKHVTLYAKCGALRNKAMVTPPIVPATGIVMIHEKTRRPTRCQLTALRVPTPTVAPVMHIDVDTGRAYCEKTRTVIAAPISIDDPK
jgi:hypothetical protein